jgi:hypothetical protein
MVSRVMQGKPRDRMACERIAVKPALRRAAECLWNPFGINRQGCSRRNRSIPFALPHRTRFGYEAFLILNAVSGIVPNPAVRRICDSTGPDS